MMSRPVVLALVLLFLFSMASARPMPNSAADPTAQKATMEVDAGSVGAEEECKGITEEECLQRRTLLAHTDYIYTNRNNKP